MAQGHLVAIWRTPHETLKWPSGCPLASVSSCECRSLRASLGAGHVRGPCIGRGSWPSRSLGCMFLGAAVGRAGRPHSPQLLAATPTRGSTPQSSSRGPGVRAWLAQRPLKSLKIFELGGHFHSAKTQLLHGHPGSTWTPQNWSHSMPPLGGLPKAGCSPAVALLHAGTPPTFGATSI